jgi:hypothetical protein
VRLGGADEERAAVGAAEHASERASTGEIDPIDDLAALAHARQRCEMGHATHTQPSASRQMPSGTAPSSCAKTRRSRSEPSSAMSNAVKRPPKLSPMISVRPSG